MEIFRRGHVVQTAANGGVDDGYTEDTEECTDPEGDDANADVWTYDIDNPVGRKGCNSEDDEEGDHVILVFTKLVRPNVQLGFPFGHSEQGGTESSANKIAECCTCGNTCAGKRQCPGHTPNGATKY